MDEDTIMYLALVLVLLLISLTTVAKFGKGIGELIALGVIVATGVLILILTFADYLLVSMGFGVLGITFQPALDYTINKGQKAVLKEVGGIHYATGFITANLFAFEFKQEMGEDAEAKMVRAAENWERAVSNIDFPFKYHVIAAGQNVQEVRDELEGKRSYQEYQLSQALQSAKGEANTAIAEIQRKINVLQRKMDRISQGEKPIGSIMYIETTAIGVSEKAAEDELERQINALQIALSTMNVDLLRVVGRELYTLFQFNYSLPMTVDEMKTHFDQQK